MRLARFLMANGMDLEAMGLLALARQDDPALGRRRETPLLSGIAAVRANRPADARPSSAWREWPTIPEAVLWRSVLDARERSWARASAGFRRAGAILDRYPEEVAGALWQTAFATALETGDLPAAEIAAAGLDRLSTGSIPGEERELVRARLDEASGRPEDALKAYDRLAGTRAVRSRPRRRSGALPSRPGRAASRPRRRRRVSSSCRSAGGATIPSSAR